MTLLGNPIGTITVKSKQVILPVTVPEFIPPQPLEFIDPVTKTKKKFDVKDIQQYVDLLKQGFELYTEIRGATGSKKIEIKTDFSSRPKLPPPATAGFNPKTLIGVGVAAAIMLSLYLSLNKK